MLTHLLKPVAAGGGTGIFYPTGYYNDGNINATDIAFDQYLYVGNGGTHEAFIRFLNVTVPNGATITEAYVQLTNTEYPSDSLKILVYLEDSDDAVAPTTRAEFLALTLTSAYADWDYVTPGDYTEIDSPSMITPVQEVVNRGSWSSGNAMMAVLKDGGTSGPTDETYIASTSKGSGQYKGELHITWTS